MYLIDRKNNRIKEIEVKKFSKLGFGERKHLQEWIANNPSSLGEELLIIQKEFSGFGETNERLDLLALDKFGNLVIIENKLDDSGKDVTWQTIKYASYCSSLTKQEIIRIYQEYLGNKFIASEKIIEFFGDDKEIDEIILNQGLNSQRLIMIAANFRKEVTSSVLWLLNFNMKIQCIKVTPYAFNEHLFLNVEQILPTKDTAGFTIRVASKAQEEMQVQETLKNRHSIRLKYWEQFIIASNQQNSLFLSISPSKDNWITKGVGLNGVVLALSISSNCCRCEINISKGSKEVNKDVFDFFYNQKDVIETKFGEKLIWMRMDENVTCRIKVELNNVSYFEENDWKKMNQYLIDTSVRMEKAFKDSISKVTSYLKHK